ncbi:hypothetical protein L1887_48816 [Cichorium endivia]|nr:hypothetical protein L1887_48816 [Cichorium endivia]
MFRNPKIASSTLAESIFFAFLCLFLVRHLRFRGAVLPLASDIKVPMDVMMGVGHGWIDVTEARSNDGSEHACGAEREEKGRRSGYQSHGAGESAAAAAAAAGQPNANPTPTAGPAVRLHSNSSPAQPSKPRPVKSRPIIPHTRLATTNIELRRPLAIQRATSFDTAVFQPTLHGKVSGSSIGSDICNQYNAHVHTRPTPLKGRGAAQDADADADAV